jgi:hypothetical protein
VTSAAGDHGMTTDDIDGLRYLRSRLETVLKTYPAGWARQQIVDCIAALDSVLRSAAPQSTEVKRVRARAKSILTTSR